MRILPDSTGHRTNCSGCTVVVGFLCWLKALHKEPPEELVQAGPREHGGVWLWMVWRVWRWDRGASSQGDAGTVVFEFVGQHSAVQLVELHQLDQVGEFGVTVVQAVEQLSVLVYRQDLEVLYFELVTQ